MLRNLLVLTILSTVASANTLPFIRTDGTETPQATTGTVQGQVTDPSGAAVAGASVVLMNSITNYKVATKQMIPAHSGFRTYPTIHTS